MQKRLSNIFKTTNVTKLTKTILKSSYRILQESICLISCIIFEEKYFSGYILLTDQISLSGCLYFVRYWAICVVIVCQPGCGVINFEINLVFLTKPFSPHDQNVKTKNLNILRTKRALRDKIKSIFHQYSKTFCQKVSQT